MEKTYIIKFAPIVDKKDLTLLDKPVKERILKTLFEKLTHNPQKFSKPLKHTLKNFRSLRIGSYRVVFHVNEEIIEVLVIGIGHRSEIYERLDSRI